jgi:hypothetical protein
MTNPNSAGAWKVTPSPSARSLIDFDRVMVFACFLEVLAGGKMKTRMGATMATAKAVRRPVSHQTMKFRLVTGRLRAGVSSAWLAMAICSFVG